MMFSPYTYLIGWSSLNIWYYGVRYSKKASPSDLWVKYFTSSRHVSEFRKIHGEPDIIQVRKVFSSQKKAQEHEFKVLRRLKVTKSDKWLNRTDCASFPAYFGENSPRYGKVSCRLSGESNPMFGVKGELHPSFGKKHSDETKEKIRQKAIGRRASEETICKMRESKIGKKRQIVMCPHCGKEGGVNVMPRFHFDKCKFNHSSNDLL